MPNHESKLKRKNVIQKSWHLLALGPSLILSPYLKLKSDISEKKEKKKNER